jgi:prolyl oligopeptidase
MPGPGSAGSFQARWNDSEVFFDFNSYTTPRTTYRTDVKTKTVAPWWRPEVPFASASYETKQVWYASKDGTRVPMFVTHRKGLVLDGRRPTFLTGYGGFNVSILPGFGATAAWWVEQGGVFAVPNLRGGGEFGEAWHRAGMLDKKQNVFDDFIGAAEWLIANRYTEPSRLAIRGASNGGLLVGAAFTQRPELFRAVLCDFPDLDMLGFYRFPNNNPPALLEYGNASLPEQFPFLRAYSPYQHVEAGTAYPAIFFTTGDADTRVPPLQARKMTARVQAATTSGRPVLLLYDTKAGHAGGRPVGKVVDDLSLQLAFLAGELGMAGPGSRASRGADGVERGGTMAVPGERRPRADEGAHPGASRHAGGPGVRADRHRPLSQGLRAGVGPVGDGQGLRRVVNSRGSIRVMEISVAPIVLGAGERLFEGVGTDLHGLRLVRTVAAPGVTHLKFAR